MREIRNSHFQDLLTIAVDREKAHAKGVAVSVLPSLIKRTDGAGVFEEGQAFSGIERKGNAEACLTITASPHVTPTIFKDSMVAVAEEIVKNPVSLPHGMQEVEYVSPQLILWWQETSNQNKSTDMLRLSQLTSEERTNFCDVMARQTEKAVSIINNVEGKPRVWGSWGNGTLEERAQQGKSRGVPTNKFGHLHITHFNPNEQNITLQQDLPATERLNHYGPWNVLVHREFDVPFSRALNAIGNRYFNAEDATKVKSISQFITNSDGTTSSNYGYELSFSHPQSFREVYGVLIETSGHFETFYQQLNQYYDNYYKNQSNPERASEIKTSILSESKSIGFTEEEAQRLMTFMIAIKPTYGQLSQWERELSSSQDMIELNPDLVRIRQDMKRYERLLQRIGTDSTKDSLSVALVRDTVTPPDKYRKIERTLPVHATAAFIIDDFEITDELTQINSIKIFPGIAATEASVERVLGTVVKRSLSY